MRDRNALEDWLNRSMRRQEARLLGTATTSTQTAPTKALNPHEALRQWGDAMRESRRRDVTVVVVLGHIGPPAMTRHPTDGAFIECSYLQAAQVHRETPLRLDRVVSSDRAEFKVAGPWGTAALILPAPPYEVRTDHA